jgi:hypothetical protein
MYTPIAAPKGRAPNVTVIITDDTLAIILLGVISCLNDTVDIVHIIGPNPKKKKAIKTNMLVEYIRVNNIKIEAIKAEIGPKVS